MCIYLTLPSQSFFGKEKTYGAMMEGYVFWAFAMDFYVLIFNAGLNVPLPLGVLVGFFGRGGLLMLLSSCFWLSNPGELQCF